MKRPKRLEEDIARANRHVTRARKALDDATDFWDGAVASTSTHHQAEATNAAIRRRQRGDQDGPEPALPWTEGAADSVLHHTRTFGLSDVVVTRQNAYDPITSTSNPAINGAHWIVQDLSDDPDDEHPLLRNVKDGGDIYLNDGYRHSGTSHPPLIEGARAAPWTPGRTPAGTQRSVDPQHHRRRVPARVRGLEGLAELDGQQAVDQCAACTARRHRHLAA